jgi:RHS repeat-associated protein
MRSSRSTFFAIVLSGFLILLAASVTCAQVSDPLVAAQAPIPGAGHHYIGIGAETVNPADGSLAFDLPLQSPAGRELSMPFGMRYLGSDEFHPIGNWQSGFTVVWQSNQTTPFQVAGWSYLLPTYTAQAYAKYNGNTTGPPNYTHLLCDIAQNWLFTGFDGVRRNLALGEEWPDPSVPDTSCQKVPTNGVLGNSVHGWFVTSPNYAVGINQPPLTLTDPSGTTYLFPGGAAIWPCENCPVQMWGLLATTITDKNGNQISLRNNQINRGSITYGGNAYLDTLGRQLISWTGLGNNGDDITLAGLGGSIVLRWGTANVSFPESGTMAYGTSTCKMTPYGTASTQIPFLTEIDLPNGTKYTFTDDGTYGKIGRVNFPSGGYVRYVWGLNASSQMSYIHTPPWLTTTNEYCYFESDMPAITDRYVSYDGTTEVLHQHFTYSTAWGTNYIWTSKNTTVTSTDLLTGQATVTQYTYAPKDADMGSFDYTPWAPRSSVPVEQTVQYQDGASHTLKTVNKTWLNPFSIVGEQIILDNGQGTAILRCYDNNEQLASVYEYGFQSEGSKPADPSCASSSGLNTSAIGPLRRQTVNAYHNFVGANPSTHIVNEPDSVTFYDGSGNQAKQTTFTYDANAVVASGAQTGLVSPPGLRGNLSTVTHWLNIGGSSPVTSYTYFDTGQVQTMTDPCGNTTCSDVTGSNHTTTYSYADNFASGTGTPPGQTNAYLTQISYPNTGVPHVVNFTWGYSDGLIRSRKDQNNQITSLTYNTPPTGCSFPDGLDRLSEIDYPDTGKTTFCYNDSPYNPSTPSPSMTSIRAMTSSANVTSRVAFDGLGHTTRSSILGDPDCTNANREDRTDTTYDGLGRVYTVSNPYCTTGDPTYGLTTYTYDALGRTTKIIPPDGSASSDNVSTSYSGNCTTVTDEALKSRKSCSDGLGRMTGVWEDPAVSNFETDYQYDALNNLLCVAQKGTNSGTFTNCASIPASWRPRTFAYDSLSRLTSSINPEANTQPVNPFAIVPTTYVYDANGNLSGKTAPAPNQTSTNTVTTTYSYDVLNRMTLKTFSDATTPHAIYTWDANSPGGPIPNVNNIGRLVSFISTWPSQQYTGSIYNYDPMGRIANEYNCIQPCGYDSISSYTYDQLGDITTLTNTITPWDGAAISSITFNQKFDSAGRVIQLTSSLVDASHPSPLAAVDSSVGYWPTGSLRKVTLGNGLTETAAYNNRLQPCRMNVNSSAGYYTQCTDSVPGGNLLDFTYGFNSGTSNNGNVASWSATGQQTFTRSFTYDSLNRISQMRETGGNSEGCKPSSSPSNPYTVSWTIDAWGNRKNQSPSAGTCSFSQNVSMQNQLLGPPYLYDTAGNMTNDGSHTYTYDAENHLIAVDGGATASYIYDPDGRRTAKTTGGTTTSYVYDLAGNVLFETQGTSWVTGYNYFGGSLVALYKSGTTGTTSFIHHDHLGSTRLVTAMNQSVSDNLDYLPFGEQIAGDTSSTHKFTTKERDTESGLDNFGARYFGSSLGRFMTPDWSSKPQTVPYADLGNPQTLNLYSYVVNNPLNRTDPLGHDWFYVDKKWQWQKGHVYHDKDGNATKDKGYAGLLIAQKTGTNKQGATTYSLTLYDQNNVVATGTGFSGNNNYSNTAAIKDGNYQILGRFDPPPTAPNPSSPDNNPPTVYGYQKIDPTLNRYAQAVFEAYGPMRAYLNPIDPGGFNGAYFHGQFGDAFHSEGWTHGCLSYGRDTTMIDYMASHFGHAWTGVSVDTQVEKPQ